MEFRNRMVELSNAELNLLVDSIGCKIAKLKDNETENEGAIKFYREIRDKLTEVIKGQIQGVSQ